MGPYEFVFQALVIVIGLLKTEVIYARGPLRSRDAVEYAPWNGAIGLITAGCWSHRARATSRVRRSVLSTTSGSGYRGLTQTRSSPGIPGRFTLKKALRHWTRHDC